MSDNLHFVAQAERLHDALSGLTPPQRIRHIASTLESLSNAAENDFWEALVKIANRRPSAYSGGAAFLKSRHEAREVLLKHCDTWKKY